MRFTPQDEQFRTSVRDWLEANLTDTIYGGSDEIQRNIIARRILPGTP